MKITLTAIICLLALGMMSFMISKDAPPLYKNLKVLNKNTTKEQMDSLMHHFANSLGKKCNFCHVFNEDTKKMDFASDAKKEKEVAREMWLMTAKLNKKYFNIKDSKVLETKLEVTCYTCHRGDEHPKTKAPMMHMGPPPPPKPATAPGGAEKPDH